MTPEQSVRRIDWATLSSFVSVFVRTCSLLFGWASWLLADSQADGMRFVAVISYERNFVM
jgi:hypothetical protein